MLTRGSLAVVQDDMPGCCLRHLVAGVGSVSGGLCSPLTLPTPACAKRRKRRAVR